jgi:hypothetical protein
VEGEGVVTHLSDLQIDQKLVDGGAEPEHVRACEACRRRWDQLAADRQAFLARARPAAFAESVLARKRPRAFVWWWTLLAPALAVLALFLWPRDQERFKGPPVAVELFVKSGAQTARFDPDRGYRAGDALQVVYTAGDPLYFTALDVEADGRVTILARDTAPLPPGTRRRLDRSFVLDEGSGEERVFVLFSKQPLDERELQRAARDASDRLALPVAWQASYTIRRGR